MMGLDQHMIVCVLSKGKEEPGLSSGVKHQPCHPCCSHQDTQPLWIVIPHLHKRRIASQSCWRIWGVSVYTVTGTKQIIIKWTIKIPPHFTQLLPMAVPEELEPVTQQFLGSDWFWPPDHCLSLGTFLHLCFNLWPASPLGLKTFP